MARLLTAVSDPLPPICRATTVNTQDIIDSDFDEPEDNGDEVAEPEPVRRRSTSARGKTGKYVDPALRPSTKPAVRLPPAKRAKTAEQADVDANNNDKHTTADAEPVDVNVDRSSLRQSTKVASEKADKLRSVRDAEMEERRMQKREREKKKEPVRHLTQEEMLAEAEVTAVQNAIDLDALLRLEEERKRQPVAKAVDPGPKMTVVSNASGTDIRFSDKDTDARAAMFPHCQPLAGGAKPCAAHQSAKQRVVGADDTTACTDGGGDGVAGTAATGVDTEKASEMENT
jgi:YL1 nuclear protein